jgi:lipopolysaccharide transport system permease protein
LNLKELWGYRDLILLFVKRDITAQYKQTILGPLWHIIQPVFTTLVFLLIFKSIAKIPTDDVDPLLFYMSGITIWNYFSTCFTATSGTFVANAGIFGKVYFPRLVIPISVVLSNMVKFCIQFLLLLIVMVVEGIHFHHFYFGTVWLLIPVLVLMMAALGFGLGVIISSLTTKYRDFTVLISFAVQLLMYATPIAYPLSYLKQKSYFHIIEYNPLSPIVEAFRYSLFGKGQLDFIQLGYSGFVILVILFIGILMFNKVERSFMDSV